MSFFLFGVNTRQLYVLTALPYSRFWRSKCLHNLIKFKFTNKRALFFSLKYGTIASNNSVILQSKLSMGSVISCGKTGSCSVTDPSAVPPQLGARKLGNEADDTIEATICKVTDIPDDGLKVFEIQGGKVLLAKTKGEIYAVGTKCSHYGAPLAKGSICDGMIRCPFHGACFNLKTGDIEDFPGLDSIPSYQVEVSNGEVKIRASKRQLEANMRVKTMAKRDVNNNETYVVVGGGGAGAKCVETLRQEGFTGRLILVSSEDCLPYDRPKISKALNMGTEALALRTTVFYEGADIDLELGTSVTELNSDKKEISLSTGSTFSFDKIFLATGGQPRNLTVPGSDLKGVFVLRNPTDANAIVKTAFGKKVVVIGTSFIGMETAAYLATDNRCTSVTVIGNTSVPFEKSLGYAIGERLLKLFEEKGVTFINNGHVTKLEGTDSVEKVIVDNETEVPAEVVIAGIGVTPSTEYLKDSGVNLDNFGYVTVNKEMETNVKGIFCGGDIASFPLFLADNSSVAIGHWQMAHMHGHVAALNMMGKSTPINSVPFFWTAVFGKSLRYTGYGSFDDVIISGYLNELTFIAYYCKGDKVVALASLGKDPAAANYANYLQKGLFLTKKEVSSDGEIAMKLTC